MVPPTQPMIMARKIMTSIKTHFQWPAILSRELVVRSESTVGMIKETNQL
jgi:hypothetical protein